MYFKNIFVFLVKDSEKSGPSIIKNIEIKGMRFSYKEAKAFLTIFSHHQTNKHIQIS